MDLKKTLLFLIALTVVHGDMYYKAIFRMGGYSGEVSFKANETRGLLMNVKHIRDKRFPFEGKLSNLRLTEMAPMFGQKRGPTKVCDHLGRTLNDLISGRLLGNDERFFSNLEPDKIFNRGLVLSKGDGTLLCATILPENDTLNTYRAKFMGPIVGDVYIRVRPSIQGLYIQADLAHANTAGMRSSSTPLTLKSFRKGIINDKNPAARCNALTSGNIILSPFYIGTPTNSSKKETGNFAKAACESILDSFIGIVNSRGDILGCAYLDKIPTKIALAAIFWNNERGFVEFEQQSPFDKTHVRVRLAQNQVSPIKFGIHSFPVPQRTSVEDDRCSGSNIGTVFDPYQRALIPTTNSTSLELYPIGSLGEKYGYLHKQKESSTIKDDFVDYWLPLFGRNTVVGRPFVLHAPDGNPWVCATIGFSGPTLTAVANFYEPIYGSIYFRQEARNPRSDTIIFGELANLNDMPSQKHNFNINKYPVVENCKSAGPTYDPLWYGIYSKNNVNCNILNPNQCGIGELSKKFGPVLINAGLKEGGQFFFSDDTLPLSGDFSISGRSVVVHAENLGSVRQACANITLVHPTTIGNSLFIWEGNGLDERVSGYVRFSQETEFDFTRVEVNMSGLTDRVDDYQIHELPVPTDSFSAPKCSHTYLKGVYDPFVIPKNIRLTEAFLRERIDDRRSLNEMFNDHDEKGNERFLVEKAWGGFNPIEVGHTDNLPIIEAFHGQFLSGVTTHESWVKSKLAFSGLLVFPGHKSTFDQYSVGNLKGKYQVLLQTTDSMVHFEDISDNNFPLTTGIVSSAGRSLVIHKNDQFSKGGWKCNTMDLLPGNHYGHVLIGQANFRTPFVSGFVRMRQVIYDNGFQTLTTITVSLQNKNLDYIFNNNWNIQVNPVTDQTSCGGQMYDPYNALKLTANYDNQCTRYNRLACAVGDLSKKHSQESFTKSRQLFNDGNLPLATNKTVFGRSLVFHVPSGGIDTSICANILPTSNTFTLTFSPRQAFDYYQFTSAVANTLRISRARVVVMHNVAIPVVGEKCFRVMVAIAGDVNQGRINILLHGRTNSLRPYQAPHGCLNEVGANYIGLSSKAATINVNLMLFTTTFLLISFTKIFLE